MTSVYFEIIDSETGDYVTEAQSVKEAKESAKAYKRSTGRKADVERVTEYA